MSFPLLSRSDTSEPTGGVDCCWSLRSASNMANKVIKAQQMDFKTALGRTLLKMGLEQMKPKQVGVFYNLALIVLSSYAFSKLFKL